MLGVIACPCTTEQREIVTGTLALCAKLLRRGPDQWMKPVQCARDSAQRVTEEVVPADVRELVQQNCETTIGGPVITLGGKNDSRREQAARERHLCVITSQQPRWL